MKCYTSSEQFLEMKNKNINHMNSSDEIRNKAADKQKKGKVTLCIECENPFYQKRATKSRPAKKYCSTTCYRSYMAKRFDRWIANPEKMSLPQCYDEFLDREELTCVVEGCSWKGKHLTVHMNLKHGQKSDEFKRATGFNLSTGVVSKSLAQALRERECVGIPPDEMAFLSELGHEAIANNPIRYRSLEGREHANKSRALAGPGPIRVCEGCGKEFQQSTPFGRAKFCTIKCRNAAYAKKRELKNSPSRNHAR